MKSGQLANRTEVVSEALDRMLSELREQAIDAAIIRGYTEVPDEPLEPWVEAATRALVADEPW